jgi:curved DNA-binding protein CbpA
MIDYFAVLQEPRRPWLDPEQLKERYQQLTLIAHPDRSLADAIKRQADTLPYSFVAITEAYRVLSNPARRLGHLLTLDGQDLDSAKSRPNDLIELFGRVGAFTHETDALLKKFSASSSAVARSVLQPQIVNEQKAVAKLLNELEALCSSAEDELRRADALWEEQRERVVEDLKSLHHRFAYLARWMDQLRERQFQLSAMS